MVSCSPFAVMVTCFTAGLKWRRDFSLRRGGGCTWSGNSLSPVSYKCTKTWEKCIEIERLYRPFEALNIRLVHFSPKGDSRILLKKTILLHQRKTTECIGSVGT